jgi:hypothetical protein
VLRREKYLCATLRLKKTALQVDPSLQKGASENAPEKEPEKQGGVGWGFTISCCKTTARSCAPGKAFRTVYTAWPADIPAFQGFYSPSAALLFEFLQQGREGLKLPD